MSLFDAFKAMKFSGKSMGEYLKKGNPFGNLSDIVSTDKLRKQWNRTKNVQGALGASLLGAKAALAKGASSAVSSVPQAAEGITAGVDSAVTSTGKTLGQTAPASTTWKDALRYGIKGMGQGGGQQDPYAAQEEERARRLHDLRLKLMSKYGR